MAGRVHSMVTAVVLVGFAVLLAGTAVAEVPNKINYQMRITDSVTGEPEPGAHELIFRMFEQSEGGTAVWDETHNVTVDETGVISVILGSTDPIEIDFDGPMWLEVDVDGETLEPRREIVSVPYAFRAMEAENADSLGGLHSDAYADSGHNHDDRYYTQDWLDMPGTLNNSGNPVDWSKLKNVPAGFADGTDDVGGVGDGHSLDAADGVPVDAVYVDDDGNVGIGTTYPYAQVEVLGSTNADAQFRSVRASGATAIFGAEQTTGALGTNSNHPFVFRTNILERMRIDTDGKVGIGTTNPSQLLEVDGNIQADSLFLGSSSIDGCLQVFGYGSGNPIVTIRDINSTGAMIHLAEDNGNLTFSLEPDIDAGGGAWMRMTRTSTQAGFYFDGNYAGTQNPKMTVLGSSRSAVFDMSASGNSSVALPAGAISASEMSDEPGVACGRAQASAPRVVGSGYTVLDTISIVVPGPGYVLVLGTCQPTVSRSGAVITQANFGVSDVTTSLPPNQDISLRLDTGIGDGTHEFPVSVHGLFDVAGVGTYHYYLLAYKYAGNIYANDIQLTAVYIPTAYGSVTPTLAEGPQPVIDESVAVPALGGGAPSPQPSAEEINMARIQREMDAMKAELEALKAELERGNRPAD